MASMSFHYVHYSRKVFIWFWSRVCVNVGQVVCACVCVLFNFICQAYSEKVTASQDIISSFSSHPIICYLNSGEIILSLKGSISYSRLGFEPGSEWHSSQLNLDYQHLRPLGHHGQSFSNQLFFTKSYKLQMSLLSWSLLLIFIKAQIVREISNQETS